MRKTTIMLSIIATIGQVSPGIASSPFDAVPEESDRVLPAPPARTSNPKVPRKTKDPVNIPISSGRFRPYVGEDLSGNGTWNVEALYIDGQFVVECTPSQGQANIFVVTPSDSVGKLYRLSSKQRICVPVGYEKGAYVIEVKTSVGNYYRFEFELVD